MKERTRQIVLAGNEVNKKVMAAFVKETFPDKEISLKGNKFIYQRYGVFPKMKLGKVYTTIFVHKYYNAILAR